MSKNSAVNFVVHKISAKNHPVAIAEIFGRMGYSHSEISQIFIEAGKSIDKLHQELIASNDFLPTLNENLEDYFKEGNIKIFEKVVLVINPTLVPHKITLPPKTLYKYPAPAPVVVDHMKKSKGAVTRHVFAFRFLYSLSLAVLGIIIAYISIKSLEPASLFEQQMSLNYWKTRIISPSIIAAVSILVIFGVYILQLFMRRLQNAGMSPWLSLLLFTPLLAFLTILSQSDQKTILILSCVPLISVFIIAVLTPQHRYRL